MIKNECFGHFRQIPFPGPSPIRPGRSQIWRAGIGSRTPKTPKTVKNEWSRVDFEWFWTIFHQNSVFLRGLGGYLSTYAFHPGRFGSGRAPGPAQKPPKTLKKGSRTSMKSHVFDPKIGFLDVLGPVKNRQKRGF